MNRVSAVKTRTKAVVLMAAAVLAAALIGGLLYLNSVKEYRDAVNGITFEVLDLNHAADGVYNGECDVGFISARVAVTVKDGKLQGIALLEHKNDRGAAAEAITEKIVAAQGLDVDAISGATNSCKVIKKAVENALTK